jgi:hypothetical protein
LTEERKAIVLQQPTNQTVFFNTTIPMETLLSRVLVKRMVASRMFSLLSDCEKYGYVLLHCIGCGHDRLDESVVCALHPG